jgi:RimJ/RimL family protein N-acetyltransferase
VTGSADGRSALVVRRAVETDSELVRLWRNDPVTRASSLTGSEVTPAEHDHWFRAALVNPDRSLLVVSLDIAPPRPVAVCRFDVRADNAEVSINVDPTQRGRGLGGPILVAAIAAFRAEGHDAMTLGAVIREGNAPSIRLFEGAGFRRTGSIDEVARYELAPPSA